jgi:hypothetical protein
MICFAIGLTVRFWALSTSPIILDAPKSAPTVNLAPGEFLFRDGLDRALKALGHMVIGQKDAFANFHLIDKCH